MEVEYKSGVSWAGIFVWELISIKRERHSDSFHFIWPGKKRWPFNSGHTIRDAGNSHANTIYINVHFSK
jgi:hypothetical protein